MIKTYKRLLDIKYNGKIFSVFLDDKNRRTFLEITKEDKYAYPTLEDFTYLHNLYNNKNPYLKFSEKFRFEEKVRLGAACLIISPAILNASKFTTLKLTDEDLKIIPKETTHPDIIYINDLNVLDSIFDSAKITFDDVKNAIDANSNLTPKYQKAAHSALRKVIDACPNIDLRIFFENIQNLEIEEMPYAELQSRFHNNDACIDFKKRKIYTSPEVSERTLCHEFIHAFYNLVYQKDDTIYIRNATIGNFYEEAQTEELTGSGLTSGIYGDERYFKNYLDTCTTFTLDDYYEKGVWYLTENIDNTYPDVDIDYVMNAIDTRKDTRITDGIEIIDEPISILDELFKICKAKATESANKYEAFGDFAVVVLGTTTTNEYFQNYFEEFNDYLRSLGEKNIFTYDEFAEAYKYCYNFQKFIAVEGEEPFAISGWGFENTKGDAKPNIFYDTIDESNNPIRKFIGGNYKTCTIDIPEPKIIQSIFKYRQLIGTENFWHEIATTEQVVSPHLYQKVNICLNNAHLTTTYVEDLNLKLGLTPNHELGFILRTPTEVIYQSHPDFIRCTTAVNFSTFLDAENTTHLDHIELSKYLNTAYLLEHEGQFSTHFPTLSFDDNHYTITPIYNVKIDNHEVPLRHIYISKDNLTPDSDTFFLDYSYGKCVIPNTPEDIPKDTIYLETILKHSNKLPASSYTFNFTMDELLNLFQDYLLEIKNEIPER